MGRCCAVLVAVFFFSCVGMQWAEADVTAVGDTGFRIRITRETNLAPADAYRQLVEGVSKWWLDDHTWTADADNLSMDLERGWFVEKLPDGGFARHMAIVFHQPGQKMTLTGGLGPLQEMGLDGAMTVKFKETESGKTQIELVYNVHGGLQDGPGTLSPLATAVDGVLTAQIESLAKHCDGLKD